MATVTSLRAEKTTTTPTKEASTGPNTSTKISRPSPKSDARRGALSPVVRLTKERLENISGSVTVKPSGEKSGSGGKKRDSTSPGAAHRKGEPRKVVTPVKRSLFAESEDKSEVKDDKTGKSHLPILCHSCHFLTKLFICQNY